MGDKAKRGYRWRDLTPDHLSGAKSEILSRVGDMRIDRKQIEEEIGFDLVSVLESVAYRLGREARRREDRQMAKVPA